MRAKSPLPHTRTLRALALISLVLSHVEIVRATVMFGSAPGSRWRMRCVAGHGGPSLSEEQAPCLRNSVTSRVIRSKQRSAPAILAAPGSRAPPRLEVPRLNTLLSARLAGATISLPTTDHSGSGGNGARLTRRPFATRCQYPGAGVGTFIALHRLRSPLSEIPNRRASFSRGSDQTRS